MAKLLINIYYIFCNVIYYTYIKYNMVTNKSLVKMQLFNQDIYAQFLAASCTQNFEIKGRNADNLNFPFSLPS